MNAFGAYANSMVPLLSFVLGWLLLWPARRPLGAAYHLLALPAGLLAWASVAMAAAAARLPFGPWPLLLGVAWLAAIAWGVLSRVSLPRSRDAAEFPPRTPHASSAAATSWGGYAIAGAAAVTLTVLAQLARLTASGYDSVFHYQSSGIWLADTGRLTADIVGGYSLLVPGIHAGVVALGGSWTYVVYPLLAANLLALLAYALWRWAFRCLAPRPRAVAAAVPVVLLTTVPSFVFHAFYVHTQMITATYLLASLVALRAAEDETGGGRRSLLAVAGLVAAGFALTRPDGLGYAFVLLGVAAVPSLARSRPSDVTAFLAPPVLLLGSVYATAFARLGMWHGDKLTGKQAAALLLAMILAAIVWALAALPIERLGRRSEGLVLAAAYAMLFAGVGAIAIARTATFSTAAVNAATNLFSTGGYGWLWYSLAGLVALTLAMPSVRRYGDWSSRLLFTIAAFFAVALAVHGATHPGRLAPADSFNRVAFHAVPVVIWYVSSFLGAALEYSSLAEDRSDRKDAA